MGLSRWTIAVLLALACWAVAGAEAYGAESETAWPMWEPDESIEAYAKRAGLEPAQSLDLGNGETLELVLLPAGSYRMGTPPPEEPPDRWYYGWTIMLAGLILLVSFVSLVIARVYHKRAKLQLSLRHLLLVLLSLALAMMGYMRWRENEARWRKYREELETYERTDSDESPAHRVTLRCPVYIGKYEVTEGQFARVWRLNNVPAANLRLGKTSVRFREAEDWCHSLGKQLDRRVRLPFEEEWEYAARAGTETRFFFGELPAELERYAEVNRPRNSPKSNVGQKMPNPFGLYDVYGNVSEWCYVSTRYYKDAETILGPSPEFKADAVLRGGWFYAGAEEARSAFRGWTFSIDRFARRSPVATGYGFRVVVELPPEAKPPAQDTEGTK